MTDSQEFTPEQTAVLEKVEKLLRLAARNTSPEEAASATAKAQDLLLAYNLDVEAVGKGGTASEARRERQAIKGGMYQYQRELWSAVARLNFCMYWTITHHIEREVRRRGWDGEMRTRIVDGHEYRHTLVGKRVSVRLTVAMGTYLEQTIERLVKERYPQNSQRFMREAVAYREGIADELYMRLQERREKRIEDEERRRREASERAGVSTSTALTIGDLEQQERDANNDFRRGVEEGTTARERAERAQRMREAEEAYTRWAEANPEEARRQAEEARKARRKYHRGGGPGSRGGETARDKRTSLGEYWSGRDKGREIGIDPQTTSTTTETRRLT
jgi:hypothetical protein